jgi:hypothetical protein
MKIELEISWNWFKKGDGENDREDDLILYIVKDTLKHDNEIPLWN